MNLENKNIGFAMTGSFSMLNKSINAIEQLIKMNANVIPIMSYSTYRFNTRFERSTEIIRKIEIITGKKVLHTLQSAEQLGYKNETDIVVIAPATGNTISKLACNIVDTPVTMAAKSNLRNNNSIVIALSSNDALSNNAENIGKLLNSKNFFFVPFRQDNPITKPNSIVADFNYIPKTIELAFNKEQVQPILL